MLTNYYQSESLLIARSNSPNQSALSQYSSIASLVGINMTGAGDNKAMEAMQIIQSRNFVKHLITFEDILPSIMAPKSYDTSTNELILDKISQHYLWF